MAIDRRMVWAVIGAVLVVGTLMWFAGDAAAPGVGGQPARSQARGARTQPDGQAPPDVKLEALGTNREGPVDQGRNPFRFRPKPAPPPVLPPPSPLGGATAKNESGTPGIMSVPSGPPPPPPIQLKLIGIVKRGTTMIAVLTDGQEPEHGIEGQIILGRYRLLKVNADSVEIAYEDGRGRTTLRLPPQ